MRILLVAIGYRGYADYYSRALERLGHEVTLYTGLRQYHLPTRLRRAALVRVPRLWGTTRDYLWSEQVALRAHIRKSTATPDLALFINSHSLATDDMLEALRSRGVECGLWLLDEIDTLPTSGLDLGGFGHLASFTRKGAAALSAQLATSVAYVPQGFAIDVPSISAAASPRALVLGAPYQRRLDAVHALRDAGFEVEVVGRHWKDHLTASDALWVTGDVSLERSVAMSGAARPCVNAHRSVATGVSPRIFEIGGAGGLVITDNPQTAEFFDPGAEMLYWDDPAEAAQHVARAVQEPGWAAGIAAAGARRVRAEHTLDRRLHVLLGAWGLAEGHAFRAAGR